MKFVFAALALTLPVLATGQPCGVTGKCYNGSPSRTPDNVTASNVSRLTSLSHSMLEDAPTIPVKLNGGSISSQGRVQVFHNGVWGGICDDLWTDNDATVVCRTLGYSGGRAVWHVSGTGPKPIWLDNLQCHGTEASVGACAFGGWSNKANCDFGEVGVDCATATVQSYHVRLWDGPSAREGRVVVLVGGMWRTICGDNWRTQDAKVICRMLGFSSEKAVARKYRGDHGSVYFYDVHCKGTETNFGQCPSLRPGLTTCRDSAHTAGVSCPVVTGMSSTTPPDAMRLRLVSGGNQYEGNVQVWHEYQWGTVCDDDDWDDADARVACRMLGLPFTNARAVTGAAYGRGMGMVWLASVNCHGNETSLEDCRQRPWGRNSCSHAEDAGVICADHSNTPAATIPYPTTTAAMTSLSCFACDDLSDLKYCGAVKSCNPGEVCFVSSYTSLEGHVKHRSGCIQQSTCTLLGRRRSVTSHPCLSCCATDFCNSWGCGDVGFGPRHQRGPVCLDCSHVGNVAKCDQATLCRSDEMCSFEEYSWGDTDRQYRLGCKSNVLCATGGRRSAAVGLHERSVPLCHGCCTNDFCNRNCTGAAHSAVPIVSVSNRLDPEEKPIYSASLLNPDVCIWNYDFGSGIQMVNGMG